MRTDARLPLRRGAAGAVAAIGLFAATTETMAVTRSCTGEYLLLTRNPGESGLQPPERRTIAKFRGVGRCDADDKTACRERARDAILACGDAHAHATQPGAPEACSSAKGVRDYSVRDLSELWSQSVIRVCCAAPLGPAETVLRSVSLVVRSGGHRRCGRGLRIDASGASRYDAEQVLYPPTQVDCAVFVRRCPR